MEGAVESAIAAAVEPVADDLSGAGRDRGDAGEAGEGGLVFESAGVRPGDEDGGGADRTDAALFEQSWRQPFGERAELALERGGFRGRCLDAARAEAEREQAGPQLGIADLVGAKRGAAAEQPDASERSEPLAERARCGQEQRPQLVQAGASDGGRGGCPTFCVSGQSVSEVDFECEQC